MTDKIKSFADEFVGHLRKSSEYLNYEEKIRVLLNYPDLMKQINEYRRENFEIQNNYEGDELYDRMEEFSSRYEDLIEDSRVREFLDSEANLCKLIRDVNTYIIEGLEFK